jgi:hypothetical protein
VSIIDTESSDLKNLKSPFSNLFINKNTMLAAAIAKKLDNKATIGLKLKV